MNRRNVFKSFFGFLVGSKIPEKNIVSCSLTKNSGQAVIYSPYTPLLTTEFIEKSVLNNMSVSFRETIDRQMIDDLVKKVKIT